MCFETEADPETLDQCFEIQVNMHAYLSPRTPKWHLQPRVYLNLPGLSSRQHGLHFGQALKVFFISFSFSSRLSSIHFLVMHPHNTENDTSNNPNRHHILNFTQSQPFVDPYTRPTQPGLREHFTPYQDTSGTPSHQRRYVLFVCWC